MANFPARDEIAGNPSNAAAKVGFGKLWDALAGVLGTSGDKQASREALGISAANTPMVATAHLNATDVQAGLVLIDAALNSATPLVSDSSLKRATTEFVKKQTDGYLVKTVTSADVTLTADEAVSPIIEFQGALTANRIVTLPNGLYRKWMIRNATTGGFTLSVKTNTGAAFPIQQGKFVACCCDGTTFLYLDNNVLEYLKTIDGTGSGLDADLVDGFHASQSAAANSVAVRDAQGKLAGDVLGSAGSVPWSGVQNKPTTLGGYGITDALTGVSWAAVTAKPTTRDGFGITDVPKTDGTGAAGTWPIGITGQHTYTGATAVYLNYGGTPRGQVYSDGSGAGFLNNGGGWGLRINYGTSDAWSPGNIIAFSDERVKKNWRGLTHDVLERICDIKSGVYERTDIEGLTQVGVSAQDLQKVIPEAVITHMDVKEGQVVSDDPDAPAPEMEERLSVNYGGVAMVLVVELAKEVCRLRQIVEGQE